MDRLISCVILLILATLANGNKYSVNSNKEDDTDNPFKMMKVNLMWNKAKLRMADKTRMRGLYQDLKDQDQLESDLKKRKANNEDEDGEYEAMVRRKFLDVLIKYDLEGLHPDVPPMNDNNDVDKRGREERWGNLLKDKKLSKLWKKAQLAGFTDRELGALKAEFEHHADKLDEINAIQGELRNRGMAANSVEALKKEDADESLQIERKRNIDLKQKYKDFRSGLEQLEEKITGTKVLDEKVAGGFRHPKVIDLWFAAKNSNFTQDELDSFQTELTHFEHKLTKLEHLEDRHYTLDDKHKVTQKIDMNALPDVRAKDQEKLKDYTKKVKKHEADLRYRINQRKHSEL